MATYQIVLLSIFVPVLICSPFIIFVLAKWFFLKKYSNYLRKLEIFLNEEPFIDTLTILRTIDVKLSKSEKILTDQIISYSNDKIELANTRITKIQKDKEKFGQQTIIIEEKLSQLNKIKDRLLDKLTQSKVFSCRTIIKQAEERRRELNNLEKNINEESIKFLNPIQEFNNTEYEYIGIYKILETKIDKWKQEIVEQSFSKALEEKQTEINNYLEAVHNYIDSDNQEEMLKTFTSFKKVIYNLLMFDNHYESFKNAIFYSKSYSKLMEYIELEKKNTEINFDNLNIAAYDVNIKTELEAAKNLFFQLDVSNTKEHLKNYFNNISGLYHIVQKEVCAYNFSKSYGFDQIEKYLNIITKRQNELKEEIDKIRPIDPMFFWSLDTHYDELINLQENIQQFIKEYMNFVNDPNQSYMSKQNLYKKIFLSISSFIDICNLTEKRIHIFYRESSNPILKYHILSKTYITGLSKIKKTNIILKSSDNELIFKIEELKKEIDLIISNSESAKREMIQKYVDKLFNLIVLFLNKVVNKSTITKVFSLICSKYSYYELIDQSFNQIVQKSEEQLKNGDYFEGLKLLVGYIHENYSNNRSE